MSDPNDYVTKKGLYSAQPSYVTIWLTQAIGQRQLEQEDQSMTQPSDFYGTQTLYPLIDKIIAEMERRFVDEDPTLRGIAACHPDSSNPHAVSIMKPFAEAYHISGSLEAH